MLSTMKLASSSWPIYPYFVHTVILCETLFMHSLLWPIPLVDLMIAHVNALLTLAQIVLFFDFVVAILPINFKLIVPVVSISKRIFIQTQRMAALLWGSCDANLSCFDILSCSETLVPNALAKRLEVFPQVIACWYGCAS